MHRFPDHDTLLRFVRTADAAISAAALDGAILHVNDLAPVDRCFRWHALGGAHPLDLLLGFAAPTHWRAVGVSCSGVSHRLDGTPSDRGPVVVTALIDRSGDVASVIRRAGEVTVMPDPLEGTVADACRRSLGLPTAPPPPSTLGLWTLTWLDRVVDLAGQDPAGERTQSWPAVARLHAAARPPGDDRFAVLDPPGLAVAASGLALAWPWARLRADPSVLDVPGPRPSAHLAGWMDDGMWARWLLGLLPSPDDLMAAVHALLPPAVAQGVETVARATWPAS
jgi:hypothetical protein